MWFAQAINVNKGNYTTQDFEGTVFEAPEHIFHAFLTSVGVTEERECKNEEKACRCYECYQKV